MLEQVNLGTDVTKLRTRLQKNYPLLFSDAGIDGLVERQKKEVGVKNHSTDFFEKLFLEAAFHFNVFWFQHALTKLAKHPFSINRISIFQMEAIFGTLCNLPLSKENLNYLNHLCDQRINEFVEDDKHQPLKGFALLDREENPKDPEYPFYFALTLRQINIMDMPNFLKQKAALVQTDYLDFLSLLLYDYKDIFEEKTIKSVKDWIERQREERKQLIQTSFLPKPRGWKSINGRLSPAALKKAFSFLSEIGEFSHDEVGFLSQEETAEFLKFGLAYPNSNHPIETFTLNLSRERSKRLFFYCIFKIRSLYDNDLWDPNRKTEWAELLKRRFTNFADMNIERIKNELRDRKPKILPKGFEVHAYLPYSKL